MNHGRQSDAQPAGRSSDLPVRVVSAVILIAIALSATWAGGLWFSLFALAIALLIYFEWATIALWQRQKGLAIAGAVMLAVVLVAGLAGVPAFWLATGLLLAAAIALVSAFLGQAAIGWVAAGVAYAGLAGLSLALLRGGDSAGLAAIIFLFAAVWATDIFAYFVGRAVGGPKLAPAISPGKTRSGAVGGLVAAIAASWAAALIMGAPGVFMAVFLGALLSIAAQIGDLGESAFKRHFGVKDSGKVIPGHGGVMDRVDGLVVAAMVLYLAGALVGSADNPATAFFTH